MAPGDTAIWRDWISRGRHASAKLSIHSYSVQFESLLLHTLGNHHPSDKQPSCHPWIIGRLLHSTS